MLAPFLSHLLFNICNYTYLLGVYPYSKNPAVINCKPSVTRKLNQLSQGSTNTEESQVLLRFSADGNKPELMLFLFLEWKAQT